MGRKLDLIGEFQSGKSLLFNVLCRRWVASSNHGLRTTTKPQSGRVASNCSSDEGWTVTDTPGMGYCENDNQTTEKALQGADLLCWIQKERSLSQTEIQQIKRVDSMNKPFAIIINHFDTPSTTQQLLEADNLANEVWSRLKNCGLAPIPLSARGPLQVWPQLLFGERYFPLSDSIDPTWIKEVKRAEAEARRAEPHVVSEVVCRTKQLLDCFAGPASIHGRILQHFLNAQDVLSSSMVGR
jgi:GTP-binding protein EngB required for normal cell division